MRQTATPPGEILVEVTRRGRLNLHRFDAALKAKLGGYLVELGILQAGQTPSAQEAPPEAGNWMPCAATRSPVSA